MNSINSTHSTILLTFDIEDWFQVENFKPYIPFSSWANYELRVEKNVHRILNLLDSIPSLTSCLTPQGLNSPLCALRSAQRVPLRATFFILGWLGEHLPHLIKEIKARGHEIASHGYNHKLCREEYWGDLREDLKKSKKVLEDITGSPIYGYRAPNFSIDKKILNLIEESGYLYDSSYNSYSLNKRYGKLNLFNNHHCIPLRLNDNFYEFPVSNLKIGNQVFHWGGGGYFRIIPAPIFVRGVKTILKKEGVYLFYLHSWEIDPDQPKIDGISSFLKFRHYVNLDKTFNRLQFLINFFKGCSFLTCFDYLKLTQLTQSTRVIQSTQQTQ